MLKRFGLFLCAVSMAAVLASCGDDSLGGGVGEFTTVNATASAGTLRLESDLIAGNTCSAGTSTGGTFSTDNVDFTVSSTALFDNALDLKITRITVQYTPTNPAVAPALPENFFAINETVAPDSSLTIPVAVVPDSYKVALFNRTTQNLQACSTDIYEYYVKVVFEVSEPGGNGKTRNVNANLNIAIADRT